MTRAAGAYAVTSQTRHVFSQTALEMSPPSPLDICPFPRSLTRRSFPVIRFFYSGECPIAISTALPLLDAAMKLEVGNSTDDLWSQNISALTSLRNADLHLEAMNLNQLEKRV